ncbi:hypothetical protein [Azospirillum doebereinerae]
MARKAQRLERALIEKIGFPRIAIPADEAGQPPRYATDAGEIDRLLGTAPTTHPLRQRLKHDLASAQARWTLEAQACGLTDAIEREIDADRRVDALLSAAATTPARSIAGVIAKLAIAAEWGGREPDADGHPWTFLHGALADLTAITAKK